MRIRHRHIWIVLTTVVLSGSSAWFFLSGRIGTNGLISESLLLRAAEHSFHCIAFSPNSKLLVAGQSDGTITVWETTTGALWVTTNDGKHGKGVTSLAFSRNGGMLAWGGWNDSVTLLDIADRKIVGEFASRDGPITALSFSADDHLLGVATFKGKVRLWTLDSKKARITFENKEHSCIESIAFAPDSNSLAVGGLGKIHFVDIERNTVSHETARGFSSLITGLSYTAGGTKLVALQGDGISIGIWDAHDGRDLGSIVIKTPGRSANTLALSPDGQFMAVGLNGRRGETSFIEIWEMDQRSLTRRFPCHESTVSQVAWSPDGKIIATASFDKTVKLWDAKSLISLR